MLLLSAYPALVDDQKLGNRFRDFGTQVLIDHRQNKVDACAHSSRRPDRTVIDVDPVLLHPDIRKPSPETGRLNPMRRRTSTIKKSGFSENKRPVAK
jgi:hypothetical protein